MYYIRSSYIDKETIVMLDFTPYDPDAHLKIMEQLISHAPYSVTPQLQSDSYPITPEISCMTPVVQPIIPPSPQQLKNNMVVNEADENKTDDEDMMVVVKRGRRKLTDQQLTPEEARMRKRILARESARRCRKNKRDLIEEQKKHIEMIKKKNNQLLRELERIQNNIKSFV
jgi:hypothetical protein